MRQSSNPNSLPRQANAGSATEQASCLIWIGEVKAEGLVEQVALGCPPTGRRQRGPAAWLADFGAGSVSCRGATRFNSGLWAVKTASTCRRKFIK
ncbi:MAG: hypothetical protein GY820_29045 [Gammaproteobacteria bacterium]|nr:hypothetical protein [Gammaproteobacteria bacterium]MCP5011633.1 hypothetical protein [Aestuariibacter sp.]